LMTAVIFGASTDVAVRIDDWAGCAGKLIFTRLDKIYMLCCNPFEHAHTNRN
jgi:hypothetical protein